MMLLTFLSLFVFELSQATFSSQSIYIQALKDVLQAKWFLGLHAFAWGVYTGARLPLKLA